MHSVQMFRPISCCEARKPAVNSSVSPGRKKPINRPHSAKMIRPTAISPPVRMMVCGSRNDGTHGSYGDQQDLQAAEEDPSTGSGRPFDRLRATLRQAQGERSRSNYAHGEPVEPSW